MKKILASVVLATTFSAAAVAEGVQDSGFNNTWVDVEYVDVADGGVRARGSYSLDGNLNIIGSLGVYDKATALTGGVSYGLGLANNLDLLLHGELTYVDFDCGPNDCDDTDIRIGTELRFQLNEPLELYGDLYYHDDLNVDLGARFSVTDGIKIIGGIDLNDDETLHIGARFSF
ncbi:MAG: hypothetical protein HRU20_08125 [Pseudomonadales bacterium]|nr:hypothetical protein [Pseudomonadales bacterium]